MANKQVKICGLTSEKAVRDAVKAGADYIGFVFFPPSPRHVTPAQAAKLASSLPSHVKSVAVTVDASDADLDAMIAEFTPDFIQLHGHETHERVQQVKKKYSQCKIIKAISVRESDDVAAGVTYSDMVDMLLFDAKAPASSVLPGGNGLSFDWTLLQGREFTVPWMLSGGLNVENVHEAMQVTGALAVDVSSAVESAPGEKDMKLVQSFTENAKRD